MVFCFFVCIEFRLRLEIAHEFGTFYFEGHVLLMLHGRFTADCSQCMAGDAVQLQLHLCLGRNARTGMKEREGYISLPATHFTSR